jgi:hypothetical protein
MSNGLKAATPGPTPRADLPTDLENTVAEAIVLLQQKLRSIPDTAATHQVLIIEGFGDGADTIAAAAAYLVGLLASTITRTLLVRASIENTTSDRQELLRNVEAITGTQAAPLTTDQKQDERNPWLAEGLWHLCLFLSSKRPDLHPPGTIVALDLPHIAAKDHGFDVVGLYRSQKSNFGISFVECKAYEKYPNHAISDAVGFYKELDRGDHDARARQVVSSMRDALPATDQNAISVSLWKGTRAYLPNPHYDASSQMDWKNARSSFSKLAVPPERIIIMPHSIQGFSVFFDQIATEMLNLASKLNHV